MSPKLYKKDFYQLLKLALPLSVTALMHGANGFFQTLFLSHLGHKAMVAGAIANWLFGIFIMVVFGTLSSINILVSHKHGAKDTQGVACVIQDGLLLAVAFSIPTTYLFWNIAPILLFLGQDQSVISLTETFLHALTFGLLPFFVFVALTESMLGLGYVREVTLFVILKSVLVLFFSFSLILGNLGLPFLSVAGAGWAITITYWIIALILLSYFLLNNKYRFYSKYMVKCYKPVFIWQLLKLGFPMGVMSCCEVGFFFTLTLAMGALSIDLLAANQMVLQYMGMLIDIIFCVSQAITVRMGFLIGSKDILSAIYTSYAGICISISFIGLLSIVYWLEPDLLISLDFDVNNPQNRMLVTYAKELFALCAVFQLLESIRISLLGALRALKDTMFTLIGSIITFWGVAFPIGYLLTIKFNFGGYGLWYGMIIGSGVGLLLFFCRFNSKLTELIKSY